MEDTNSPQDAGTKTRRYVIAGAAMMLGSLATGAKASAQTQQPAMKETPATPGNAKRTSLHYDADFNASPKRVYEVLLDPKLFAAFTGMPAEIDAKAGGAFSLFGGLIVGRNVELIPDQRIVQAWRPSHWDPGVYSIVRFELKSNGGGSSMALDHTGFPEGLAEHLDEGWHGHYLDGLRKYFTQPA